MQFERSSLQGLRQTSKCLYHEMLVLTVPSGKEPSYTYNRAGEFPHTLLSAGNANRRRNDLYVLVCYAHGLIKLRSPLIRVPGIYDYHVISIQPGPASVDGPLVRWKGKLQ